MDAPEFDGRNSDSDDEGPQRPRQVSTNRQVKERGPVFKEGNLLINEPKYSYVHKWKKRIGNKH
jgi:hypothetical protein